MQKKIRCGAKAVFPQASNKGIGVFLPFRQTPYVTRFITRFAFFEHVFFIFWVIFLDNYKFLLPLDRTFRKKLLLLLISVRNKSVQFDFLITRSSHVHFLIGNTFSNFVALFIFTERIHRNRNIGLPLNTKRKSKAHLTIMCPEKKTEGTSAFRASKNRRLALRESEEFGFFSPFTPSARCAGNNTPTGTTAWRSEGASIRAARLAGTNEERGLNGSQT